MGYLDLHEIYERIIKLEAECPCNPQEVIETILSHLKREMQKIDDDMTRMATESERYLASMSGQRVAEYLEEETKWRSKRWRNEQESK